MTALRILLIDDIAEDVELACQQLREGFPDARFLVARTAAEFERALDEGGFDLVILDYWLEWSDGLEIFHRLRARHPDCPVMMLTGSGSEEVAVEAMIAGFDDYVLKGRKGYDRLSVRVRAVLARARDRRLLYATQAALQESRDQLDSVLNALDEVVWSVAPDNSRLLFVNAAAERVYGVPHRSFYDNFARWPEMVHADDRQRVVEWLRMLDRDGSPREIEFRIVRPGGEVRWLHNRARIILDAAGRPLRTDGIITDITERKLAQKRAADLHQIIEQSAAAVLITDRHGNIEYANPKFTRISGYSLDEVRGQNPRLLKSGTNPPEVYAEMWAAISAGREWHGILQNRRKDGTLYWESDTIFSIRDESGAISHYIAIQEDISERVQYEERLAFQASHDALTGLPNRSLFQDRLDQMLAEARRRGASVAVILLDIDNFKFVNDSLGHGAGDELLTVITGRLGKSLRQGDTLARVGGDEFALLLPDPGMPEEIGAIAERLRQALTEPLTIAGKELFSSGSIGLAIFPGDGADGSTLLKNADAAMHRAKEAGRNQAQFYSTEMSARSQRWLALEAELRHALERGELQLHYQPTVDLFSGEITGAEALLRWNHPTRGLVAPLDFIPLAEESGLIVPIGDWVIDTVCAQVAAWQRAGLPPVSVAVNVSARQFERHDLKQSIDAALQKSGLAGRHLKLELTETLLMREPERSVALLDALRPSGVQLSLDDFGTGYSSLNYLKRFPFDYVKIDQSFIQNATRDPHAAAIVKAVLQLAHDVGLKVIAEGVETLEQMAYLRSRYCDEMQGYFFSRPVPAGAFEQMLKEGRRQSFDLAGEAPRTLLLVDDEEGVLNALYRVLRRDGYHILRTTDPLQALDLLAANRVGVIVSDQRMPQMTGTEFLRHARAIYPDTIRIVLSGYTDLQTITDAINEGAVYKFLTKPWEDDELRAALREAFERHAQIVESARVYRETAQINREMAERVARKAHELGVDLTSDGDMDDPR